MVVLFLNEGELTPLVNIYKMYKQGVSALLIGIKMPKRMVWAIEHL